MIFFLLVACVFFVLIAAPLWAVRVIVAFSIPQPWGHELERAAAVALDAPNVVPITVSTIWISSIVALIAAWTLQLLRNPHQRSRSPPARIGHDNRAGPATHDRRKHMAQPGHGRSGEAPVLPPAPTL